MRLATSSSGRTPARFACFRPSLISNLSPLLVQELLIDKLCNALFADAAPSGPVSGAVQRSIRRAQKRYGGLWVGGRVTASSDALTFTPNSINAALHAELAAVHIPMPTVRAVRREFGWLTGIVVVEHARGEFRFRCFGATNVARILASHAPGT
jgi:hypothetical protein